MVERTDLLAEVMTLEMGKPLPRPAARSPTPCSRAGEMSPTAARVAASALVFGYFAALEQWYADGCTQPIANYVEDGMQLLRKIWPPE